MTAVPLAEQIKEVEREIAIRKPFFANRVARHMVSPQEADARIRGMEAVLGTLKFVEKHAEWIRLVRKASDGAFLCPHCFSEHNVSPPDGLCPDCNQPLNDAAEKAA